MRATRDAGFGDEVKRRIILGTYALSSGYYDAYYGQAQKVRTLISRDFDAAFERADVLVSPTAPTTAFRIGEKIDDPLAMYLNDLATIPANLSGVPGISVPSGLADEDGLPAGVQILAPVTADDRVYRVGAALEALLAQQWGGRLLDQAPARRRSGLSRPEGSSHERLADAYDDALAQFDPALGLEVHVELNTATKMFCGCPTEFGAEPNTQTCPTCLGLPGSMPVLNRKGVESAIRIGLALNCQIAEWCRFARKNYFYPDMPKNFQTSQYDEPIAFEGFMDVSVDNGDGTATPIASRSSAPTWRRTPASRCTSGAAPAASTAPTTRSSTTTGPGSRSSRSSPSPCSAPARRRPRSPERTSPSCASCCSASGSATSGWSRARCAAT